MFDSPYPIQINYYCMGIIQDLRYSRYWRDDLTEFKRKIEGCDIEWKLDSFLGYVYGIDKDSPYSSKGGKLYQHHYVMCEHIGRRLEADECVHHIDRNRANNELSNLMLLTHSEHMRLHAIEDGYYEEDRVCPYCKRTFTISASIPKIHCSAKCSNRNSRKFNVTKQELEKLVWEMPTTKVAKVFGVSDVAVAKRCKVLGVDKPPRGYWAKVLHGKV